MTYFDFYFILQKGGDCMSEKFEKLRFRVAKTGRAKYISHLDFVRCVQRAIRRSGLPVHYTNGFHPHMEAVFATALPLGMESIGEVLEIRFAEPVEPEAARTCLQASLPEGMKLLQVYQPVHKMGELAYVRYRVTIPSEQPEQLFEQWHAFLQQPEVLVEKKSKRGMRTVDLLPPIVKSALVMAYSDCRGVGAGVDAVGWAARERQSELDCNSVYIVCRGVSGTSTDLPNTAMYSRTNGIFIIFLTFL